MPISGIKSDMRKIGILMIGAALISLCTVFSFATALNNPLIHDGNVLATLGKTVSKAKKIQNKYENTVCVPVIMYHSLIKDPNLQNEYYIDPTIFEADIKYLKAQGYTSVTISELVDYVYGKGSLPNKPIVLSFDDGYYNNCYYAYPLLKKYNMKAVISLIGAESDKFSKLDENIPAYSYITWNQAKEMSASGFVEFQNHTYDLHGKAEGRKGSAIKYGESYREYKKVLEEDLGKLQSKLKEATGYAPQCFTYPYGAYSEESEKIIKGMGFKASFSCTEGINLIEKGNKESLYLLRRYLRGPGKASKTYFNEIEKEIQNATGG